MSIVIVGANGQLGSECVSLFEQSGYDVIPLARNDLNLEDLDSIQRTLISKSPSLVINCSAYTAVDRAEEEVELADKINHLAVAEIAKACKKLECPLVHISTDYVFDGSSNIPYTEKDLPNPKTVYGKTKLAGELEVQARLEKYIILRTSWVFGVHGNNFVKTMLRMAETKDAIGVVSDQVGCPTYAAHIAEVILNFASAIAVGRTDIWGLYHFSGDRSVSWYQFACEIFDTALSQGSLKRAMIVKPIKSHDFPVKAVRPSYSVMNIDKLSSIFPVTYSWAEGLRQFIEKVR